MMSECLAGSGEREVLGVWRGVVLGVSGAGSWESFLGSVRLKRIRGVVIPYKGVSAVQGSLLVVPEGIRGFKNRVSLSPGFLQPQRIVCGPGEGTVKILWGYLGSQGAQWAPVGQEFGGVSQLGVNRVQREGPAGS